MNAAKIFRIAREVTGRASQKGTGAYRVSAAVVVQADRDLNQSLEEFFLWSLRLAPHIFEHFVGLKEFGAIEQFDSCQERVIGHVPILARKLQVFPGVSTGIHRGLSYPLHFSII